MYYNFEISGKERVNNFVNANNVNSRGGYSQYQNGANGQRVGYSNYSQYQNGDNGPQGYRQSDVHNGYNNRSQNGGNRSKSSSFSSNGTDDGASDKAERSSGKSERYLRAVNLLNYYTFFILMYFNGIIEFNFQGAKGRNFSEKNEGFQI
jgi:hypothetical protein